MISGIIRQQLPENIRSYSGIYISLFSVCSFMYKIKQKLGLFICEFFFASLIIIFQVL